MEKLHTLPAYVVDRNPTADTTESMNGYSQQTDFYKSDASNGPRTEENQKTATVPKSQTSASTNQLSKSTRASNRKQSILMNGGKAKQKSSSIRYHHHHQLKHYHIPFETYQQQSTRPTHCSVRNPSYPSGYSEYPPQMTGGIATITPLATGQCCPVELGCHPRPELPTLVKVKAWYTVSKQGLTY